MSPLDGLILGAVQGFTEFLPISSSGHLILMREALGINTSGGLAFDAMLQLATVIAVIAYFRKTLWDILAQKEKTLLIALIAGTIPAVAMGVLLEDAMESIFRSAALVALMLIAGSILFLVAEKLAKQKINSPSVQSAWWIGWFQTLALIPGISRSGATISGGLLLGLTREAATRFSFLLSIPILTGSGLKKIVDTVQEGSVFPVFPLVVGAVTAFGVGLVCIHVLLRFLKRHTLIVFVWYRLALAALVLFLLRG